MVQLGRTVVVGLSHGMHLWQGKLRPLMPSTALRSQALRTAPGRALLDKMAERLGAMAIAAAGAFAMTSGFVVSQPAAHPEMARLRGAQGAQPSSGMGFSSTVLSLAGAGTVAAGLASQRKRTALRAEKFAGGLAGATGAWGEYQFDPAGLSSRYSDLVPWFRESELKHGRVAMLAFVGLIAPDAFRLPIDGPVSDTSIDVIAAHNKLIGPGLGEGQMWVMMLFVGAIESVRFKQVGLGFENLTVENAGDLGLRGLAPGTDEGMEAMKTRELKNGRLAMLAVGGCLTQAVAFDVHHFPFLK